MQLKNSRIYKMGIKINLKKMLFTSLYNIRYSLLVIRCCQHTKLLTTGMVFCCLALFFFLPSARAAQTCKDSIIATAPDTSFTILNNGTAIDKTTSLMWMRCSLGQKWNGNTCSGTAAGFSWTDGLKAASGHIFADYTDWRLPNKNELESIVECRCFSPSINAKVFPATPSAYFWSSSPYAGLADGAWSVDFGYGSVNASVKRGFIHIRLVRDKK